MLTQQGADVNHGKPWSACGTLLENLHITAVEL